MPSKKKKATRRISRSGSKPKTRPSTSKSKSDSDKVVSDQGKDANRAEAEPFVDRGNPNPFGGATKEEISAVAGEYFGADTDLDAPEASIELESLSKVITTRLKNAAGSSDPKAMSVFIVSDRP